MAGKKITTDWELAHKRLEQIKSMRLDAAEKAKVHFNEQLELLEDFIINYERIKKEMFKNVKETR